MQFAQLKRREFIAVIGGAGAWPLAVGAWPPGAPFRKQSIGIDYRWRTGST
jgi:hypothetical protein